MKTPNYFIYFANHQKNVNTIWELSNDEGTRVQGFRNMALASVQHFSSIYKELEGANLAR
jgi:hypothetical protein